VDVCYDGIDNDCNGNIDNLGLPGGCTPIVSTIPSATCGTEVAYGGIVYSSWVTGAQGYRFRVTEVNPADDSEIPGTQVIVDMVLRNLYLHNLSNYKYNAKFKVEVAVRFNSVWQPNYSAPCFLLTPTPVSSMIGCGTQVTGINTQIFSTLVPRSTGYRYRVQRLDSALQPAGPVQEIISGIRNFTFASVTDFRYDANYSVSCAVRNTDGSFLPYGPSCTIQAPKHPTTQVRGTQCNDYAVTSYSERIFADAVQFATQYRFRLFNEVQVYDFQVDRVLNNFRLSDFPGLVPGETYSVQVAVRMPNQPDFGPYSKTCTLVIPTIARTIEDTSLTAVAFDAQVYPNPFAEQFYFKVATASQESFTIQVYDMMGRAIETRTVNADAIETTEVGANYPAGVYNVILTQGTNVKTLRVVKR
ncbi:Por secretion system C-terminal sorting domain-containing protein, partial [Flavobacterium fontis]